VKYELELPRGLDSAAVARHALDGLDGRLPTDQLGDVRLLVSELVTNALRHADLAASDAIHLVVEVTDPSIRVEVSDPGQGFDPEPAADEDGAEPGRWGLYLVETLSDRWGVDRLTGLTRVWFELDRVDADELL
jgi:anti-sigma regulatory factor (Ser/Thr protein kinase)